MHICCFNRWWDFPDGPVVKNLPSNPGDEGLISGWGTKIPQAQEQLTPATQTAELLCCNQREACMLSEEPVCPNQDLTQPKKKKTIFLKIVAFCNIF